MDVVSAVRTLTSLQESFSDGSRRWQGLRHSIHVALDSPTAHLKELGPPEFANRPLPSEILMVFASQSWKGAYRPYEKTWKADVPAIKVRSSFHGTGPRIAGAFDGIERFEELAAPAWNCVLQLPESAWELLSVPQGQPDDTLVGRMWLGPYRQFVEISRMQIDESISPPPDEGPDWRRLLASETDRWVLNGVSLTDPVHLWLLAVYNLGWKTMPETPLRIRRFVWSGWARLEFDRDDAVLDAMQRSVFPGIAGQWRGSAEWFGSEMGDPFLASSLALERIIMALRQIPAGQRERPDRTSARFSRLTAADQKAREGKVRDYIRGQRSEGRPIEHLTRDSIAVATGVPATAVSGTAAWKALCAEKKTSRAKPSATPMSTGKDADLVHGKLGESVDAAIDAGDWDRVRRAQSRESRSRR